MPRALAALAIFLGAGVMGFGVVMPTLSSSTTRPEPEPRVTLAPLEPEDVAPTSEVNGIVRSVDGSGLGDVRIELIPLFSDESAEPRSSRTDAKGRFAFADVDVTPGTPYVADAHFDDATFPSDVLRFGTSAADPVVIRVAQTTKRARDVRFDVESIAIVGDARGAQAVHAITVRNRGTRAYVGRLRLPLLPGANAIDPRGGLDRRTLQLHGGELVSLGPNVPGRHDITYTYIAPMPSRGLTIEHRAVYPTARFELLVGGELAGRRTDGPSRWKSVDIGPGGQKRTYQRFEARNLSSDESARFIVSVRRGSPVLRFAGLTAAAALAIGIVAFPLMRRRRRSKAQSPPAHQPIPVE